MPAYTSADVTITIMERWISGVKRHVRGSLTIAATNTYSTGGVPLPTPQSFGMVRQLDRLMITGSAGNTTEYMYGHDKTNNKLQAYEEESTAAGGPLLESPNGSALAGTPRTIFFYAIGW